jgi:hypothetical protein
VVQAAQAPAVQAVRVQVAQVVQAALVLHVQVAQAQHVRASLRARLVQASVAAQALRVQVHLVLASLVQPVAVQLLVAVTLLAPLVHSVRAARVARARLVSRSVQSAKSSNREAMLLASVVQ